MLFCKIEDLNNESDVEQKLILPILTNRVPLGLGYLPSDFRSKVDIKKVVINKATRKSYVPDYLVIMQGLPMIVIEAKHPDENLEEALREARLYAMEINSSFPKEINPCRRIIVTNGKYLLSGSWDSDSPDISIEFSNIQVAGEEYSKFIKQNQKEAIASEAHKFLAKVRGNTKFIQPTHILGGKYVRAEELPENSFGSHLTLEYRHLFNPISKEDRTTIVKNAYIASSQRDKHLEPINKIILAAKPASVTDAKEINDTSNPKEIYTHFQRGVGLQNELLLLIGNVGSGKSTFVDYLREVALPDDIKSETIWISIDLNDAPVSKDIIYNWIQESLIEQLRNIHRNIDFDALEIQKKIYSVELNKIEKGAAAYYEKDSDKYKDLMSKRLYELETDSLLTSKAYCRYLCGETGKLLIVTLDNCDKRNKETQLLMFDVAKWLKQEFKCLVFLPLRDTTYDQHKEEPPLDTVIKDLVFRIDPPQLARVLNRRIQYAIPDSNSRHQSTLKNGITLTYTTTEQKVFLACILRSLFQSDPFFRSLINGIAGRDIRRGIEIFLSFCKSGHIDEAEILKMRVSRGDYTLPPHLITRVLFRGNKRYYSDDGSYIKNLFASHPESEIQNDPFIRISILQWLKNKYHKEGPNRVVGYEKATSLVADLLPLGHAEERIIEELGNLVKSRCILTEAQTSEVEDMEQDSAVLASEIIAGDELISLAPAGFIHLGLLNNVDYLATCAEDVYYSTLQIAQRIADRLTGKIGTGYLSLMSNLDNADDLITYLEAYKKDFTSRPELYLDEGSYTDLIDLESLASSIESFKKRNYIPVSANELRERFPIGTVVTGQVLSLKEYGLFIQISENVVGMIHISDFQKGPEGRIIIPETNRGDSIKVQIIEFNEKHNKFNLALAPKEEARGEENNPNGF